MQITFLGTGTSQGIPVIGCDCEVCRSTDPRDKRLRTSILVTIDDVNIGVDAGPDFRQQMLNNQVQHLDAILLTHEHNDHIIGLDDVRPFNFKSGEDMPIYCAERVAKELRMRFAYAFDINPYPGAPRFLLKPISAEQPFKVKHTQVFPFQFLHGKMPVLGFRFGDFVYITDAKTVSEETVALIRGAEVLVVNALHREPHHSHFNLDEAIAFIERVQPRKAFLTHMSHRMGLSRDIEEELPSHISLAHDGLKINL